ncbi:MAG TPA: Imm26 family immunity protein [Verrucomicrobiae bacterium]|nr:Imm26 family immunity protein [Verrucomicrobiae bacterium]
MKTKIEIGDVFEVKLPDGRKFIQYVANDVSMLNSSVIRSFKKQYAENQKINVEEIVRGDVNFYAHVFLKNGCKLGYWNKIGHTDEIGRLDMLFRDSHDYGKPAIKISEKWYVWKINGPFIDVGKLTDHNQRAEIGVVVPPDSVVHRIQTGKYDFVYPGY